MAQLLVYECHVHIESPLAHRFGGLPLIPAGSSIAWPTCKSCKGAMQFIGQLLIPSAGEGDKLTLIFMCQNDPGMCDEWDANLGGNCVITFPSTSEVVPLSAPTNPSAVRKAVYAAKSAEVESTDYGEARTNWMVNQPGRCVLGQILGVPDWMQFDETPNCDSCAKPMRFIAQLEEGPNLPPDYDTAVNFGGGCAYVFDCDCGCPHGKMLWQQ